MGLGQPLNPYIEVGIQSETIVLNDKCGWGGWCGDRGVQ